MTDLVGGQLEDGLRMAWAHLLMDYGELRLLVRGGSSVEEKPGMGIIKMQSIERLSTSPNVNRELTNKSKHVLKTHLCVFPLKSVLLLWFGWCWDNNKRTILSQPQPNQPKNTFFKHNFERKKNTHIFVFVF